MNVHVCARPKFVLLVPECQRSCKPNAKRKLAFGFAEAPPIFERSSMIAVNPRFRSLMVQSYGHKKSDGIKIPSP